MEEKTNEVDEKMQEDDTHDKDHGDATPVSHSPLVVDFFSFCAYMLSCICDFLYKFCKILDVI